MSGIDNSITLGVGEISMEPVLGCYYQDITPALVHINNGQFASLDENGIPYHISGGSKNYKIVLVIQYALMCFDLIKKDREKEKNKIAFKNCLNWMEAKSEIFMGAKIWRSKKDEQYQLEDGWISGMYQGQALSLYLRAYQLYENPEYLNSAELIFQSFFIPYEKGGFVRRDSQGNLWFEEYPTKLPSFVLNGFIYSMLGILDFYRVTKNNHAEKIWDECLTTLQTNLHKYDIWYWSVYDQLKKQLISYYYMKNVHIPLMKIMFLLTKNDLYLKFFNKWNFRLTSKFYCNITLIMYRIRPKILKFKTIFS